MTRFLHYLPTLLLIACLFANVPAPAHAQEEVEGIAAVVNDDVVSLSDLRERIQLTTVSAGIRDSEEIRRRLAEQVMQALIDEKLKLQEAKRLEVEVTDEEVEQELSGIAARNSMSVEQFLGSLQAQSLSVDSLRAQLRAELSWRKVVSSRLRRQVNISKEDVQIRREQLRQQQGKTSYQVSEIFLPVDSPSQDQAVEALANRLLDEIRQGAPFAAVAAQFSQGVGAKLGGNLGWVQKGQLPEEIDVLLDRIGENRVSPPIRTREGWHLIAVRGIRESTIDENTKVSLKQLIFDADKEPEGANLIKLAAEASQRIASCDDMQSEIEKSPSDLSSDMGTVTIGSLNAALRSTIAGLGVGEISQPLDLGQLVALIMVCGREGGEVSLPNDAAIENDLSLERLELLQRRYLRDLRSTAFIDRRV
jgi:peptidyl-prolyl cis-trans isomerase SurA